MQLSKNQNLFIFLCILKKKMTFVAYVIPKLQTAKDVELSFFHFYLGLIHPFNTSVLPCLVSCYL